MKLRVSSAILSEASAVFKALLLPRFKEGNELSATSTVEIPFPEDDPIGMVTIAKVLHMRNNKVSQSLTPAQISVVASLTDKYACMEAMKFVQRIWMLPHMGTVDPESLSSLLSSAYLFKDDHTFALISTALVWCSIGSLERSADSSVSPIDDTLRKCGVKNTKAPANQNPDFLDDQRLQTLVKITDEIENAVSTLCGRHCDSPNCRPSAKCAPAFVNQLSTNLLWPYRERGKRSLEDLFHSMGDLDISSATQEFSVKDCGSGSCGVAGVVKNVYGALRDSRQRLKATIEVPCLSCLREGNIRSKDGCAHRNLEQESVCWLRSIIKGSYKILF